MYATFYPALENRICPPLSTAFHLTAKAPLNGHVQFLALTERNNLHSRSQQCHLGTPTPRVIANCSCYNLEKLTWGPSAITSCAPISLQECHHRNTSQLKKLAQTSLTLYKQVSGDMRLVLAADCSKPSHLSSQYSMMTLCHSFQQCFSFCPHVSS